MKQNDRKKVTLYLDRDFVGKLDEVWVRARHVLARSISRSEFIQEAAVVGLDHTSDVVKRLTEKQDAAPVKSE